MSETEARTLARRLKPLSATMVGALDDIAEAGGSYVRYQGGFWGAPGASLNYRGAPPNHQGTLTIHALVTRGLAEYTEWKDGRSGRFPIRVTLLAALDAPLTGGGER